ncbi:hypothetical protein [Chryseobacterium sp. KMC2]|uniref:hypothetical protein n=1 Tax=Chryseobacterium sp. KMC2 TaxID=2800705 RepID=UPI0019243CD2|nr:hypothetical protein [Chryseobacterium sp. KMC2]MBL3547008.1 hypothetical protein [Chryseobacterium sp. KMC2]
MKTIKFLKIIPLLTLPLFLITCKKSGDTGKVGANTDKNGSVNKKGNFHIDFLDRISNEEIIKGKENFKNLNLKSHLKINLNYNDFEKMINSANKKNAKFFFLSDANDSLSLGMALSDDNILNYDKDALYILSGDHFVPDSNGIFKDKKKKFDAFKSKLVDSVSKNDPCDMIIYTLDDIKRYLQMTRDIEAMTLHKIIDLQFEYIQFKDFTRKDGTLIDYTKNKDSRISFAVKTNYDDTSAARDVNISSDIINFYYDAGDLKP